MLVTSLVLILFSLLNFIAALFEEGDKSVFFIEKKKVIQKFLETPPLIKIIQLDPVKFNLNCSKLVSADNHGQDRLFHEFLMQNPFNSSSRRTGYQLQQKSTYYFLPAYPYSCQVIDFNQDEKFNWWKELDSQINTFAIKQEEDVVLDRIFIASTHPHIVPPPIVNGLPINHELRNVIDIRYMRSDNQETPNGRDVFIPYVINFRQFKDDSLNQSKRPNFLFAPCNEKWDDRVRKWRVKAFSLLKNVSDSIVLDSGYDSQKFDIAMKTSDFCIILPGDTTSTSKCWKAIFSGCIPVIFVTNKQQLPYERFLDWSKFSIIVLKDILNQGNKFQLLLTRLQNIRNNPKRLQKFKIAVAAVAPCFNWQNKNWPSPYHLALLDLIHTDSCAGTSKRKFYSPYICY